MSLFDEAKKAIERLPATVCEGQGTTFEAEAATIAPGSATPAEVKVGGLKVEKVAKSSSTTLPPWQEEPPEPSPQSLIVRAAYAAMEEAFFQLPEGGTGRKVFKLFIAKSATLKRVDEALDERLAILRSGNASPEARALAMQQLQEGMDYWLKLCLAKMKELGWQSKAAA